jgi:hypothetical protein
MKMYATDIVCDRLTFERTCGFGVVAFRSSEWERSGANGRDGYELLAHFFGGGCCRYAVVRLKSMAAWKRWF